MADPQLDEYDYYTLLGIEPSATDDELRRAFKKFALKYHPDRFAGGPEEKIERATAIYRRGSEAIEVLSDPKQRKAYDAGLARGELRLTSDPGARRENVRASRPKTEPGTRRSVRGAKAPKPPETIQSPSARAFYAKAVELARAGDTRAAWRAVQSAIAQEPGNPILEEALKRIERQMR